MTLDEKLQNASEQARILVRDLEAPPLAPPRPRWVVVGFAAAAVILAVVAVNAWLVTRDTAIQEPQAPTTDTTTGPDVSPTSLPLVQGLQPGFINPCHVVQAAVEAVGIDREIGGGARHNVLDPGFRLCDPSPAIPYDWNSLHAGLYNGPVTSDEQAGELLESLLRDERTAPWVAEGASTWSYEGEDEFAEFEAAAVRAGPYLYFVTDGPGGSAMQVAQAAAVQLQSWEPDPHYVCGLLRPPVAGLVRPPSAQFSGFEVSLTGAGSFSHVCEAGPGDALTGLHLFWRDTATSLGDAGRLLESADDLPGLAELEWTQLTSGIWRAEGREDGADRSFHAVAFSADPDFFIVTHADFATALEAAYGVADEVSERRPAEEP
jgi:hypothetical protein